MTFEPHLLSSPLLLPNNSFLHLPLCDFWGNFCGKMESATLCKFMWESATFIPNLEDSPLPSVVYTFFCVHIRKTTRSFEFLGIVQMTIFFWRNCRRDEGRGPVGLVPTALQKRETDLLCYLGLLLTYNVHTTLLDARNQTQHHPSSILKIIPL